MPRYDYICPECSNAIEIERSIHHPEGDPHCFHCDVPLKKVFTPTPAVFKGRGWYSKGG